MAGPSSRAQLGLSLDDAARAIGVARPTLSRYEANPLAVTEPRRSRIAAFYRDLAAALERALARRSASAEHVSEATISPEAVASSGR